MRKAGTDRWMERVAAVLGAAALVGLAGCSTQPAPKTAGTTPSAAPPATASDDRHAESAAAPAVEAPDEEGAAEDAAAEIPAETPLRTPEEIKAEIERLKAESGVGFPAYVEPPQPPDGVWLTDDDGRQYFLETIPRSEVAWITPDRARISARLRTYDLVEETKEGFTVKIYNPATEPTMPVQPPPTKEEIAARRATYVAEAKPSDRLRFQPFDAGLPARGQWRNGFDFGDINGDGATDLVHGPSRGGGPGGLSVFLGDGGGHWQRWSEADVTDLALTYGDAAVGDLDGDGKPDVVLGMHLQGVAAFLGDGQGGFTNWSRGLPYEVPGKGGGALGFSSRAVSLVDWNGDGRLDILALGEGPRPAAGGMKAGLLPSMSFGVALFLNQGDGSWRQHDQGLENGQIFGDSLTVADFNGDGHPDFATSASIFGRTDVVDLGNADGSWTPIEVPGMPSSGYIKAVAAGDFDRDGLDDLAVGYLDKLPDGWIAGIDLFYPDRQGGWRRRTVAVDEGRDSGAWALATGDVDGDGALDLAAVTADGRVWIFPGDGAGFVTREDPAEIPPHSTRCTGYHVAIRDLDGDGKGEVVAGFAGEPSALFDATRCTTLGAIKAWRAEPAK